jgi:hypothetical protein
MNELLSLAIKARGGLDRWNTVTAVEAPRAGIDFTDLRPAY